MYQYSKHKTRKVLGQPDNTVSRWSRCGRSTPIPFPPATRRLPFHHLPQESMHPTNRQSNKTLTQKIRPRHYFSILPYFIPLFPFVHCPCQAFCRCGIRSPAQRQLNRHRNIVVHVLLGRIFLERIIRASRPCSQQKAYYKKFPFHYCLYFIVCYISISVPPSSMTTHWNNPSFPSLFMIRSKSTSKRPMSKTISCISGFGKRVSPSSEATTKLADVNK